MNPNIREIGNVIKQMQVIGGSSSNPSMNAPKFNQAAADIVKQGIDQKREERKWGVPFNDNKKPL
jgi:hypothetical protein